jgi:hypothetical protein
MISLVLFFRKPGVTVEYVTLDDQEYEEIVEDYEDEVLVQEFPEPPVTDTTDTTLAQGKPQCITLILLITVYISVVHLRCKNYMKTTCIYIPMSLTSAGSRSCYA